MSGKHQSTIFFLQIFYSIFWPETLSISDILATILLLWQLFGYFFFTLTIFGLYLNSLYEHKMLWCNSVKNTFPHSCIICILQLFLLSQLYNGQIRVSSTRDKNQLKDQTKHYQQGANSKTTHS